MKNENRVKNFKIALASRGLSITKFAISIETSPNAVCRVVNHQSTSPRINKAIDELIEVEFKKLGLKKTAA